MSETSVLTVWAEDTRFLGQTQAFLFNGSASIASEFALVPLAPSPMGMRQ